MSDEYGKADERHNMPGEPPMYYPPPEYGHHGMDQFSAAMARAHMAVTGYGMPYGHMPHMQHGLTHPPFEEDPATQEYYRFQQSAPMPVQHHEPHFTRSQEEKEKSPVSGDGKYQCTMCDRSFSRLYNLKSHVKTHENQRPYECPECHQRFARNHDLNRHIRTHSQIRPHICNNCGRSFARKDALKRHERMNPEGKKIHCIPDPERVMSSQNQVEAKYKQNFDKWVSNVNDMRNFDAASVISSLALRPGNSENEVHHSNDLNLMRKS